MAAADDLRSRLEFLVREVGLSISQDRIDRMVQEVASGQVTLERKWADILQYIVTPQANKVGNWVQAQFTEAGGGTVP